MIRGSDGVTKLVDFGVAKLLQSRRERTLPLVDGDVPADETLPELEDELLWSDGQSASGAAQSASGTKWTPYGVVSIVREFDGETGFTVADTFTGRTSTEGTSGQLELGVNAKIGQRVDVWGGLNYMDGGAIDGVWGGQLGVRFTW